MAADLSQIRAVVTGGADSTGLVLAQHLASRGARVHIADIREEAMQVALGANTGWSGTVGDVGTPEDVRRILAQARAAFGSPNTLVNVVGIAGPESSVEQISDQDWMGTFAANVHGPFYAVREIVPDMKREGWGVVVNFSSSSTRTNMPHRLPYVTSKWALEGMTRALARELGPYQIRVNAILPGLIDNPRMRGIIQRKAEHLGCAPKEIETQYLRYISMHSSINPDELAATVGFLCTNAARHITGQLLAVDGNIEWEM